MFVTAQLREHVNRILQKLESHANWLQECDKLMEPWSDDGTRVLAAQRALHVAVELSTDAANAIIDALVMRDPGGYADIIRVLLEEGVVDKTWFSRFEGALEFRSKLIHDYLELENAQVVEAVHAYADLFAIYSDKLRVYLGIQ